MLTLRARLLWWLFVLTPSIAFLILPGIACAKTSSQGTASTTADTLPFYPSGPPELSIFSAYLRFMNEPSLLRKSENSTIVSFRLSRLTPLGKMVAVRLVVNTDGSGQITSAVASLDSQGRLSNVNRTNVGVSAAGVRQFLQLVEKVNFWSMRSTVPKSEEDTGRKVYVLDSTNWVVEGVRSGSFHYVFRQSQVPGPLTEIWRYVAKDLANLDDSIISGEESVPPND